jgi:BirA family biotin operon repressor/biotin-[acetyl-CoA-carboxylase] ligase
MIGKKIIEFASIDSTNAYASNIFTVSAFEEGAVIWALEQHAGRGQHDHIWVSEPGKNLTVTVCLKPRFLEPEMQFLLNKAVSLGVLDSVRSMLQQYVPDKEFLCHIKWPNDIYVGEKKIGGILIENKIMGSCISTAIIGIGLNINQNVFPVNIPNPVSLVHLRGQETVLAEALDSLCKFLDQRYLALKQNFAAELDHAYNENLMGFNQWRSFISSDVEWKGKIKGVDLSGKLIVENCAGEILSFMHGEIIYVPEAENGIH